MPAWLMWLLAKYVGPALAELFAAWLKHMKAERADDPTIQAAIKHYVDVIDEQHPDWEWFDKIKYASQSAVEYFAQIGKDISRATINSLVDAQVIAKRQARAALADGLGGKDAGVPSDAARTVGMAR